MREAANASGNQRRHVAVHRPSERFVPGRAELESRHENDVRQFRQRIDLGTIEQIGRDALDAVCGEPFAQALLAEARDADDALARRRALGQPRERRPILPPTPRMMRSPSSFAEIGYQFRRRRGHHVFEVLDIAETVAGSAASGIVALPAFGNADARASITRCDSQPATMPGDVQPDDRAADQDDRCRFLSVSRLARRAAVRAGGDRRDARGHPHAGAGRHRSRLRRRALPLRREPSRDQRDDRVFREADGGRALGRDVRGTGRLSRSTGNEIPHASAGRGRRPCRTRHARSATGLRACEKTHRPAVQVHADRPAYAGEDALRHSLQELARPRDGDRRRARRAGEALRRRRHSGRRSKPAGQSRKNGSGRRRR